ncbi:protein kinase-like protein [Herbaspirillum sp. SJZ107]|nr:protein kinase-like protein [Herbaspirillum sp. SJZ107]
MWPPVHDLIDIMESFAHAIHQLQSGALQQPDFFAQLDRVLAGAPESAGLLLEMLSEAHARKPLPREVYTEVQQRIERLVAARRQQGGDDTFVQTRPGAHHGHTMRDPSLERSGGEGPFGAEPERMKGVGETLNGRFVLEECIGFGGMGTVYKALDLRKLEAADRKPYIAIKVLNVQFRGHPKSLIALQREARKAQALAHPNIVSVYDFDRDGPMVYLTMEYLQGKPLSQLLRAPGFAGMPYADTLRIVTGMANALAYAHGHGFVHCDFKPGNVFLTDAGNVKVIDFGIARVFQKAEEDVDVTVFDAGSLGALTPAYASPEMLENRDPDPRDDIFALACITYELLTGHHPFNRLSSVQARGAGMRPQRPSGLGRSQWQALKCGLALEREARTPTVARFLDGFGTGGMVSRHGLAAAAAIGVLGVGVLAAVAWHVLGRTPEAAPPLAASAPPAATATVAAPSAAAIDAALAGVPCSALVAAVRAHAVEVQGFLSKEGDRDGLKDRLAALPGVSTVSFERVREVDPGQCPVLSVFGPYWTAYRQNGGQAAGGVALRLAGTGAAAKGVLTGGESLVLDVKAPASASFLSIDVYSPDAGVAHLLPNALALDNRAAPHATRSIGGGGEWAIGKPFGAELAVLVATPAPLFDTLRPETEPRAGYLVEAAARLERIRARSGAGSVAVEFLPFTTKAR